MMYELMDLDKIFRFIFQTMHCEKMFATFITFVTNSNVQPTDLQFSDITIEMQN